MKIGALYALLSVITWSIISVITRFCLLNYEANILVFASMQIFAGGVALLLIRKPVTAEGWKAGVGYSWLYTLLQIFRNFFLAAVYLYITSTETMLVNQYRSCSNSNTGLHLFQEKTPQQRHRGDASDHGRHYPVYPYPPGNHTATGLHSRLPGSSGKLYTSHRGRENHCRQSQYLRTPKMRDLRVHHVLGRHVSHTFLDLNRPRGTLFCQRTHGRSVFNALPA